MMNDVSFQNIFRHWSIPKFGMLLVFIFSLLCITTPALANEQAPGGGGSVLNILFLGLIAYFLVRSFRRRSGGDENNTKQGKRPENEKQGRVIRPMDKHEAARQMWGHLSSEEQPQGQAAEQTVQSPAAGQVGFDEEEFIEGAKMFFARFQQAQDGLEVEELKGFLSYEVYTEAVAQAEANPVQGRTEIMLLNARLMEVKNENGRTFVTVFYDGQIRRGAAGEQPEHLRVVWEFSRDDGVENGLWTLEKINKVDQ